MKHRYHRLIELKRRKKNVFLRAYLSLFGDEGFAVVRGERITGDYAFMFIVCENLVLDAPVYMDLK